MNDAILTLAKQFIKIPYVVGSEEIEKAIELLELAKKQLPEYTFTAYSSNGIPSTAVNKYPSIYL